MNSNEVEVPKVILKLYWILNNIICATSRAEKSRSTTSITFSCITENLLPSSSTSLYLYRSVLMSKTFEFIISLGVDSSSALRTIFANLDITLNELPSKLINQ